MCIRKKKQNDEIENINQNLIQLRNNILKRENGYIDNKEIIQEESKEYTQILTTINNIRENSIKHYNKKHNVEEYDDNIITKDNNNNDNESVNNDELSNLSIKEKEKDLNINNNIQQFIKLKINIDFNFNYNKLFPSKENIIYNTDRNNNEIVKELNNNKRNDKNLSSTTCLSYF